MPESLLVLRPMVRGDLQSITEIESISRPSPWSEKQFASELESANSHPRVLLENEIVIGYVIPWHIAGEIQIQNIVVAPAYRGRGLGELLLNAAMHEGIKAGCTMAILEVRESNLPAIGLYKKYQFKEVGKRDRYYQDGETALLMSLEPIDTGEKRDAYRMLIENRAEILAKRHQYQIER